MKKIIFLILLTIMPIVVQPQVTDIVAKGEIWATWDRTRKDVDGVAIDMTLYKLKYILTVRPLDTMQWTEVLVKNDPDTTARVPYEGWAPGRWVLGISSLLVWNSFEQQGEILESTEPKRLGGQWRIYRLLAAPSKHEQFIIEIR